MRAIDADALIHELNNSHYPGAPYVDAGISIAIGKVCDAPTIEPERKKGSWTLLPNGDAICQECKHVQKSAWDLDGLDNFCHHCGADMRGE